MGAMLTGNILLHRLIAKVTEQMLAERNTSRGSDAYNRLGGHIPVNSELQCEGAAHLKHKVVKVVLVDNMRRKPKK
ncbi:hypothetical protein K449DRAFT_433862 [Hypoxylon sp. EC38]|nr:hypothetical protein K449DRAFT_433862 [Hypoxylon sp. EC38]